MSYPLARIAEALNAALKGPAQRPDIHSILLDSRRLFHPEGVLFVAIEGQRHNGHDYIEELYERGVRAFLTSMHFTTQSYPEASFLQVQDTLEGLQQLAAWHRQHFHLPVVGITGSNGKTIVKEWLYQLLQADYHIVRSPRSYNSQVGVPLSVWQLQKEHELALFEAGISLPGEMARLQRVIQPTIGILTNIGDAHDEGFRDPGHKIREKCRLFQGVELLIANLDNPQLRAEADRLKVPCFTWSFESNADLTISECAPQPDGSSMLHARYKGSSWRMRIPFSDRASLENAVSCWCLLLHLGYSQAQVAARLAKLEPVEMRLELLEGIRGCRLINDSYNSDLTSLAIALDFMGQQTRNGRRTIILSDLLQSGLPKTELYRRVAGLLTEKQVDRLLGVGSDIPLLKKLLPPSLEAHFFEDTAALARQLDRLRFREETILLKGARPFGFEYLARRLARTAHRATLEVDLTAMAKNLNTYHRLLKPRVGMMVMVKAEAYGTGSMEVARLLEYHKVSYLGVAYTDEGIELRQGGIQAPILVLNPEPADYEAMLRYRLEPEIYSPAMLRSFLAFSDRAGEALPFHLKLDTGMRRLGFAPDQWEDLLEQLRSRPELLVASVMTHLAASEDESEDDFTRQQVAIFREGYQRIARVLGYRPLRHVLNSSGIARFPQYQFDMVRLGLGLYGHDDTGKLSLLPALRLKGRVSQLKQLRAGDSVGYGRQGRVDRAATLATVSVGYADGLLRLAGQGRYALHIHGQPAPILGNVCMDMCMVDVTHIPDVREGDEAIVFGPEQPVEKLAQVLETIPYEIFTNISSRVKRVYLQE